MYGSIGAPPHPDPFPQKGEREEKDCASIYRDPRLWGDFNPEGRAYEACIKHLAFSGLPVSSPKLHQRGEQDR